MKIQVYAIRDSATAAFGTPLFMMAKGQALRMLQDELARKAPDNQFANHPADFELFELGTFDSESGLFECHLPVSVIRLIDLVQPGEVN